MENKPIKCTSKEDQNIDAISYCGECKIYMCVNCEKFHSKLLSSHKIFPLNKQNEDIFTGFCKEPGHSNKLKFFCKTHNTLCCAVCTSKIGKEGIGLHKDCDVCFIEDIKTEKVKINKSNIKYLEEISKSFQEDFENLKLLSERTINNKEDLKLKIQNVFTKIKKELSLREEELLSEVDSFFNNACFDQKILEKGEELPNKINFSLEKSYSLNIKDENSASFINECINIENNVKDINRTIENIKIFKSGSCKIIQFIYDEQLNTIIKNIKSLGKITFNDLDSLIIQDEYKQQESIKKWIEEKINKKLIAFEKIFTMSINGSSSKNFHNCCDNKGPTLTLIQTKKNQIFGGFTPLNWESSGDPLIDLYDQTFLFSLNSSKTFNLINKEKTAIYCNREYGPSFGAGDLSIESNMKKGETYANEYTNFFTNYNLELVEGKGEMENFEIKELEVFKVIY